MKAFSTLINRLKKIQKTVNTAVGWLAFIKQIKPPKNFGHLPTPPAPDYSDLSNWAVHPKHAHKAKFTPKGIAPPPPDSELKADVFFLHPTTFFGTETWNAPIDAAAPNEKVDEIVIPAQASVFNGCCRVFAPRYRQATFYVFLQRGNNARQALELAYNDTKEAFTHYIKHFNNGHPFFIASHSQGTLHTIRLLEECVEGTPLVKQMIAAYAIGFRFPLNKFDTVFKDLKPAESATDTGCIIAWDTYCEGGRPYYALDRIEIWYSTKDGKGKWVRRAKNKPLCINPLTWTRSTEKAPKTANLGGVHIDFGRVVNTWSEVFRNNVANLDTAGLSEPYQEIVSARCAEDGFLYVSAPDEEAFKLALLPEGNYHNYDYALFYMNIRENIQLRLESFLEKEKDG